MIGLDFGSHSASIAVWNYEKSKLEIIADDLGSRSLSTAVAFRSDEILTGTTAMMQKHSNIHNTFDDVRKLLANNDVETVNIPSLETEMNTEELASHFFRNIYSRVNQGSKDTAIINDCVVAVPATVEESSYDRIIKSAALAGIKVKSIISDAAATLLANDFDNFVGFARVLVIDIGWSCTQFSVW